MQSLPSRGSKQIAVRTTIGPTASAG